jgi:hypothetical protein
VQSREFPAGHRRRRRLTLADLTHAAWANPGGLTRASAGADVIAEISDRARGDVRPDEQAQTQKSTISLLLRESDVLQDAFPLIEFRQDESPVRFSTCWRSWGKVELPKSDQDIWPGNDLLHNAVELIDYG